MANYKVVDADQLDADLAAVAEAIRGKTGGTDNLTLDQMPGEIAGIEAGGGVDYLRYVYSAQFNDLNILGRSEVSVDFANAAHFNYLFQNTKQNTTVKHLTINSVCQVVGVHQMFDFSGGGDLTLETITLNTDFSKVTALGKFMYYAVALKTIDGNPLDFSNATKDTLEFYYCSALQTVRFVPNSLKVDVSLPQSPELSLESIQSIIDGLADLTGSTVKTLTFHATVGAKLTDEQKAAVAAKNWTLAY